LLTLERAVVDAGNAAPDVLMAALEARAVASADADQADRWPNPAISPDDENFAGAGGLAGFDAYETTFDIEQTFRLG
jgi:outer membrane protein, heavy metal efflux system